MVASTNVYADIVEAIGGDRVGVTAFITDPSQDPHSYESNAQNVLAVKHAALVVENGGGYDDFMNRLVTATGSTATVLDVVTISGRATVDRAVLNEHVWYDVPSVARLAASVVEALSRLDPADSATFSARGETYVHQLAALEAREAATKKAHAGAAVAITEPVPLYLLTAQGLVNKTPPAFSEAIEEGTDVSPLVLRDTLALFTSKQVSALVYNEQTSGPITEQVKKAAHENGVAIVAVTETLPKGTTYLSWMAANIDAIDSALSD